MIPKEQKHSFVLYFQANYGYYSNQRRELLVKKETCLSEILVVYQPTNLHWFLHWSLPRQVFFTLPYVEKYKNYQMDISRVYSSISSICTKSGKFFGVQTR